MAKKEYQRGKVLVATMGWIVSKRWAVTPSLASCGYAVTHAPTGLKAAGDYDFDVACAVAAEIGRASRGWAASRDPDAIAAHSKAILRAIKKGGG
jgi:hypothetical protein